MQDLFTTISPWKNFRNIPGKGDNGVESVNDDDCNGINFSLPYNIYDYRGVIQNGNVTDLLPGIYIVRQGNKVQKIAVK